MKKKIIALSLIMAMLCITACGSKEQVFSETEDTNGSVVTESEPMDELKEQPEEVVEEPVGETITGKDNEEAVVDSVYEGEKTPDKPDEAVPELAYKFAVIEENHGERKDTQAEIWYALETPVGFKTERLLKVFRNGEELDTFGGDGVTWSVFPGYACTSDRYENPEWTYENGYYDSSEITTIRVKSKEDASPEDFTFTFEERYESREASADPWEFTPSVNASIDDISINNSKYLYGGSLFRLDDETLLVVSNNGTGMGSGPASYLDLAEEDTGIQCAYKYDEAVLIKGDPEHVRELIGKYSKIYYLDSYQADKSMLYTEVPAPADADLAAFVTTDGGDTRFENIQIVYGYMKKCSPEEEIDLEPIYGANVVYSNPDGYEVWFMY